MSTTSKSPGKVALVAVDVGKGAGASLEVLLEGFPEQTRWGRRMLLEQLDVVAGQIRRQGQRLKALVELRSETSGACPVASTWPRIPAPRGGCTPAGARCVMGSFARR